MKKLLTTLVLSVALFGASSYANAQCWGGRCYGNSYYRYGGCSTGSCATCPSGSCSIPKTSTTSQCANGRCSIPQAQTSQCPNGRCSIAKTKPSVKLDAPCPSCGKKVPEFYRVMGVKCECGYDFDKEFAPEKVGTRAERRAKRRFVRFIDLVNRCRARRGLRPLVIAEDLKEGAKDAAYHCANIGGLQHTGAPEIIAMNYSNFQGALNQWTQSSGHAALLYNPNFTQCGCYKVRDRYGRVFCAMRFR